MRHSDPPPFGEFIDQEFFPVLIAIAIWAMALALLFCSGCSAAGSEGARFVDPLVLSPTPELQADVEDAAARWQAATGIVIQVRPGGVPVSVVDKPRLAESCGGTAFMRERDGAFVALVDMQVIASHPQCPSREHTVLHEVGHAVCEYAVDGEHDCHTSVPGELMSTQHNLSVTIDEGSLRKVCEFAACAVFAPESL